MAKKVGAVMVIGGGIGGIQASLDLADSGFKVYLVDKKPGIGGVMSQLDKTFPTNDCSMCILSPKLIGVGRHPNIEILSYSRIEKVEGEAGDFKVRVKRFPRYVDPEKCTGCGECVEPCPVEIPSEFEQGLANRKAIYRLFPQVVPNIFTIEKSENKSPCRLACPAGVNVQGYVALVSQGKFKEAYEVMREKLPFPAVCGRVCHHPCEEKCNRKDFDEPVAIAAIKRFVADYTNSHKSESSSSSSEEAHPERKEKVAIVGAGPGGLTCAHDLVRLGYQVSVFEAESFAGGMMRIGIPEYRLPKKIVQEEIQHITDLGVRIQTNTPIASKEDLARLRKDYQAVFVAIGAMKSKKLPIEGARLEGVIYGVEFLRDVNLERSVMVGEKVVVIGGGNVAIDVALSSLRKGAGEVHLVCLESREEMPAFQWEIEEAVREGVKLHPSKGVKRILGKNGRVTGIETIRCTSVFDSEGRFDPKFQEKTEASLPADTVIIAIGQESELAGFEKLGLSSRGTIDAHKLTLATAIRGVFAGGDVVSGPSSVIEAVNQGHEAAISIDRYLRGEDLAKGRERIEEEGAEAPEREVVSQKREPMSTIPLEKRLQGFQEIELGYTEEEVVREASRCLNCAICSECLQCLKNCKAEAIIYDMQEEEFEVNVGAIILSSGFDAFSPALREEYGWRRFPNVISSLEFERILSASGPYQGQVLRPSDKKSPGKIAWIQCVGSRDLRSSGHSYCSSVCCMYATKEAVIAKEHAGPDLTCHIYFMDMRCFGKDFDRYYEGAREEHGVEYRRSRVAAVQEDRETENLRIKYESEEGKLKDEEYDLVVLSAALDPPSAIGELSQKLGIGLNDYGFVRTNLFSPVETSREGIYVCGAISEPKDIPETVVQASGAAAEASSLLSEVRGSLVEERKYPPEIDVSGEAPRIGVFICNCGINIGGTVNVPGIVEFAKGLPGVVYAEENLYTCSQDTQEKIKEAVRQHRLNRVVVASCTPRTHEPLFQETLREAGLNPHLFEMANIRDQCSWVHMKEPQEATQKAEELVRMAVAKAALIQPLFALRSSVIQKALVIGGGLGGMISALSVADQGFEVYLVEKETNLGGNLRNLHYTLEGKDISKYRDSLTARLEKHSRIKVYKGAVIQNIRGYVGSYTTTIDEGGDGSGPREVSLEHGVIIVATGAEEAKPYQYLYGEDERVMTQLELENMLRQSSAKIRGANTVVMIQCVGSRDEERPYCSRVCCSHAVKNALRIRELNPRANIFVLYRDMRTYGFKESFYEEARSKGIIFVRYDQDKKPEIGLKDGALQVEVMDPIIQRPLLISADLLVLSSAIIPPEDSPRLAQILKVPLNQDGFFLEAHAKLRPVDFSARGIFLAGMAHGPKFIDETIAQAQAAAERACTIISKSEIESEAIIIQTNERQCRGCGICASVCPYEAILIDEETKKARVTEILCQGCGSCSAACPNGAAQQRKFTPRQILSMVDAAL